MTEKHGNHLGHDDGNTLSFDQHWHLDKRVPVSIIFTIVIQAASTLWFINSLRKDVDFLQLQMRESHARETELASRFNDAIKDLRSDIKDSTQKIDRLIERLGSTASRGRM